MTRKELIKGPGYWIVQIQIVMYEQVTGYMLQKGLSIEQFSKESGISEYKLKQITDGDYIGTIQEMTAVLLACGKVPKIIVENLKDQK